MKENFLVSQLVIKNYLIENIENKKIKIQWPKLLNIANLHISWHIIANLQFSAILSINNVNIPFITKEAKEKVPYDGYNELNLITIENNQEFFLKTKIWGSCEFEIINYSYTKTDTIIKIKLPLNYSKYNWIQKISYYVFLNLIIKGYENKIWIKSKKLLSKYDKLFSFYYNLKEQIEKENKAFWKIGMKSKEWFDYLDKVAKRYNVPRYDDEKHLNRNKLIKLINYKMLGILKIDKAMRLNSFKTEDKKNVSLKEIINLINNFHLRNVLNEIRSMRNKIAHWEIDFDVKEYCYDVMLLILDIYCKYNKLLSLEIMSFLKFEDAKLILVNSDILKLIYVIKKGNFIEKDNPNYDTLQLCYYQIRTLELDYIFRKYMDNENGDIVFSLREEIEKIKSEKLKQTFKEILLIRNKISHGNFILKTNNLEEMIKKYKEYWTIIKTINLQKVEDSEGYHWLDKIDEKHNDE